ncbi:MAG TPA: hypothetical protein PKE00_00900 [Planctomycetota bacterium]|nr:hypothetical protein [Planctomycetota bacterium]
MQHCLLDPGVGTALEVCEQCRQSVLACVRQDLPKSPPRLARVLSEEVDEIADHVIEATLERAREAAITPASLIAWVCRCSKNRVVDRVRYWNADRRAIDRVLDGTEGREALGELREATRPGPGLATRLDMAEDLLLLKRALADDSSPEAQAVRLRFLGDDELTWQQLSELVGFGSDGGERLRMRVQSFLPKVAERAKRLRERRDS